MRSEILADIMSYINQSLQQIEYTIQELETGGAEAAAEKISKAGQQKMREIVETSGLDKKWSQEYTSTRSGRTRDRSDKSRVDSGQMRDAINGKVTHSGDTTSIAMGWFNPDSDEEMPINFQELGFEGPNGDWIEGMNSIEDTLIYIQENIWDLVKPNEIIEFGPTFTRAGGEAPF
jgi:hypothetical protein